MTQTRIRLYLMAAGSALFWGASFPLTKAALAYMGPTALAFMRWAISALLLVGWLAWAPRPGGRGAGLAEARDLLRRRGWTVAWVALTGVTLFYFIENLALRYTTATNAGVLSNLTSIFIVFLGATLLRERLRPAAWLALVAAFIGAALVSQGAGHLSLGGPGRLGDGLMVIACLFAAVYSIGGKQLSERFAPDVVIAAVAAVGAAFLLPLALWEGLHFDLPLSMWAILLLLGLGSGALANLWWLAILARVPASRAAMMLFAIPVISAVLSILFLGEPLTVTLVVGAVLVMASMLVS